MSLGNNYTSDQSYWLKECQNTLLFSTVKLLSKLKIDLSVGVCVALTPRQCLIFFCRACIWTIFPSKSSLQLSIF